MHVIEIDFGDPVEAAWALADLPFLTFFDSAMVDGTLGRYSFIAADPFARTQGKEADAGWTLRLKSILAEYRMDPVPGLPPFQGGAAGLFSYELGRSLERLPAPLRDDLAFPDLSLGLYDVVVAFDAFERRAWIISTGLPESDPASRQRRAVERAFWFEEKLAREPRAGAAGHISLSGWTSNFTRQTYEKAVAEVIERILAGDIFQANLSQRFEARVPPDFDHFGFYRRLRRVNPAPFAAYLDHTNFIIASASPERFLRVEGDLVETRPIKGTRPRFADALVDMLQTKALGESRKDRAENVMIVDLLRNDLSKVCRPGSVQAPQLCALESYATVHHLVSTVIGRLADGFGPVDVLAAAFPGGSITGAPKLRAMEIITELEGHARGPYCGAIGYLSFNGSMDLNIVIRTASFRAGACVVQAGGGIVTASDPASEYIETLDKARRIFEAFGAKEFAQ
ncbi:aminodeoxychorismate synthase component I [Methylocella tundrae]|uniref:aminodeoxychorismate synthase n=1 Tax=Methylocella tundrae TaxID=227605 RepID=A0A4V6IMV6_METTU|nr:aminodeoxychorismate synthase component I [Methylocella tundrae]WPP03521.1 aminodeoxychorismate synthase component I [Methylocella tundrae]VFU09621.1 Aminodeoxychorismate synthase component 1 [Methylocella tundrae]